MRRTALAGLGTVFSGGPGDTATTASAPPATQAVVRARHSLGLVRRSGLVDQLELGGEAVGAGVLQQAAHGVGVQVPDELAHPPDLAGHRGLQAVKWLRAGTSGLRRVSQTQRDRDTSGSRGTQGPPRAALLRSGQEGPTWFSDGGTSVASPCRAFMASSAAICFAAFLLGALAVGKVWVPMATQYWNLPGDERRVKTASAALVHLVTSPPFTAWDFLAHSTSVACRAGASPLLLPRLSGRADPCSALKHQPSSTSSRSPPLTAKCRAAGRLLGHGPVLHGHFPPPVPSEPRLCLALGPCFALGVLDPDSLPHEQQPGLQGPRCPR